MSDISVIENTALSTGFEKRYVIIDKDTGELLDDAQGYGYKSVRNAYAAWAYKNKHNSNNKKINGDRF